MSRELRPLTAIPHPIVCVILRVGVSLPTDVLLRQALLDAVANVAQEQPDGSLLIAPSELRDAVQATFFKAGITGQIAFDTNGDRVTSPGDDVSQFIKRTFASPGLEVFVSLGLIPCQVQDGTLVNLSGPGAGQIR